MSDITLIVSPPPPPAVIAIDQGRGPQGPAGPGFETIGDLLDLTTDAKNSIVDAINELNDGVSLALQYENVKAG